MMLTSSSRIRSLITAACVLGSVAMMAAQSAETPAPSAPAKPAATKPATRKPAAQKPGAQKPPVTKPVPEEAPGLQAARPAAIRPTASLAEILDAIAQWDGNVRTVYTWRLRDYIYARKDDPAARADCEAKLLQFMKVDVPAAPKMLVARYLRLIAGEASVNGLKGMLGTPGLTSVAIYVLQQIPGAAADQALVKALPATTGDARSAIVVALGERRVAAAVPLIVPLLGQPASATVAAVALGRIGGDSAVAALRGAYGDADARLKGTIASSLITIAERQLTAQNTDAAMKLYESIAADKSLPPSLRRAAVMGTIAAAGSGAPARLLMLLGDTDTVLQQAAVARLRSVIAPDAIGPVCALFPKLADPVKIPVLAALAEYPPDRVRAAVVDAASSQSAEVRAAAMKALGAVGGPAEVPWLAKLAAQSKGADQLSVRSALAALPGRGVNDAIIAALGSASTGDAEKAELLLAAADRRAYTARSFARIALESPAAPVRLQGLRALRTIGAAADATPVLELFMTTTDGREQTEAEKTLVALGQSQAADARTRAIRTRLTTEKKVESRIRVMNLLSALGDAASLPLLRTSLTDKNDDIYDAAVRAIVSWPTTAAKDDVLQLARDSRNETHRLLAITGLVRLIGLDTYRDPEAAVADLRTAAGFAWRPEEQKLVLGLLPRFACQDALELATGFLREPTVGAEAKAAIDRINARLPKPQAPEKR